MSEQFAATRDASSGKLEAARGADPHGFLELEGRAFALFGVALLVAYSLICQRITPSVAILGPLRLDIVFLALCGAATLFPPTGRLARISVGGRLRTRLAVGGALLGATAVASWVAVPWLVVAALAFLWSGWNRGRPARGRGISFVVVFLAAMANLTAVSVMTARGLRVSPDDFAELDFRVNTLLADVPLHDVWVIDLHGHGPATMDDVAEAFRRFGPFQATPAILALGALRGLLGLAFGWEDPRWVAEETSFVHRLSEVDRQRSTTEPGTRMGIWRVVYAFPNEGAVETINGTVQLAVACAIEEGPSRSWMYLAFRVREVNWSTPFYMRLIDPFRRYLVYPTLLRQFEHTWGLGAQLSDSNR